MLLEPINFISSDNIYSEIFITRLRTLYQVALTFNQSWMKPKCVIVQLKEDFHSYHAVENTANQNARKPLYVGQCYSQSSHHAPRLCRIDCVAAVFSMSG